MKNTFLHHYEVDVRIAHLDIANAHQELRKVTGENWQLVPREMDTILPRRQPPIRYQLYLEDRRPQMQSLPFIQIPFGTGPDQYEPVSAQVVLAYLMGALFIYKRNFAVGAGDFD